MSSSPSTSTLKRAYLAIEEMQARIRELELAQQEPIAVIGMSCRLPGGADTPEQLWTLLRDGVDAVTDIPADRWDVEAYFDPNPDAPGKMSTRWGAFIKDVGDFDAAFFGISPREADAMDPQQRLLLELSWEALERAGHASPRDLQGSKTGVFVGITTNDYAHVHRNARGLQGVDAYYASGVADSVASGRLSYVLGLTGPSISIDTACSSSLVAIHLACQSIRRGESRMAIVGGVNVMLTPDLTVILSKYQMMSPDGRCKAFDASANGFVRGEGGAVILLKKLSDAISDGDQVLAVIRGSAINQDGASSGLTAPNGPSQEKVIRAALTDAGVSTEDVSYVEAHGTGTSLGDPIELQALGAVLGNRAPDQRAHVGSVKTNLGHLEAAAGVAGLMKVVLMLQHRQIPPNLHFKEPNPLIPWSRLPLDVPVEQLNWEGVAGRRIAGVSSFGFSGTNAHVVIEEAPDQSSATAEAPDSNLQLLCLSAKSEGALRAHSDRLAEFLGRTPSSLRDISFSLNAGRAPMSERVTVLASTVNEAAAAFSHIASGDDSRAVARGSVLSSERPRIGFLFTGQGSQYLSMGRGLYETQPAFKDAFDACCAVFDELLDRPLREIVFADAESADADLLDQARFTQPALFAIEWALAALWRSWGIEPAAVIGHSLGEFAAAAVAGALSLREAAALVAARGRLMHALPAGGSMAAVFAGEEVVRGKLRDIGEMLEVAAVNGPKHVVISGPAMQIEALKRNFEAEGVVVKQLRVSHAFHSAAVDSMLSEFEHICRQVLETDTPHVPRLKWISTVTGELVRDGAAGTPDYWRRNVRQQVQFSIAMKAMEAAGCTVFVEIGPHPVLVSMASEFVSGADPDSHPVWLASLRRGADDHASIQQGLGRLFVAGVDINWSRLYSGQQPRRVELPTYPFQRQRHWVQPLPERKYGESDRQEIHPLVGRRVRTALPSKVYESVVTAERFAFLDDHRLHGQAIMPATGYVSAALAAGSSALKSSVELTQLELAQALSLEGERPRLVQVVVTPDSEGAEWTVLSADPDQEDDWRPHVRGRMRSTAQAVRIADTSVEDIRGRCTEEVSGDDHYAMLRSVGVTMGPSLQGVRTLWKGSNEALGEIRAPEDVQRELDQYGVHPALLDACLQVIWAARAGVADQLHMPVSIEGVRVHGPMPATLYSHATIRTESDSSRDMFTVDIQVLDERGQMVVAVDGMRMRRVSRAALQALPASTDSRDAYHTISWVQTPLEEGLIAPDPHEISAHLSGVFNVQSERHELSHYGTLKQRTDKLAASFFRRALHEMGLQQDDRQPRDLSDLADMLGVVPEFRRLFNRLMELLKSVGEVEERDSRWLLTDALVASDEALYRELNDLSAAYPRAEAQFILVQRCGFELAAVLQGRQDPLQLLFPDGSSEVAERLYHEDPYGHVFYALAIEAVAEIVRAMPPERQLRILEVGAGTGGTTSSLVPALAALCPDRVSYTFTDIGPLFVSRAREKYAAYPFMEYGTLDIERPVTEQGFEHAAYDLVVASNVLHATTDMRETLSHVRDLLREDGHVLILEATEPAGWIDITFGLTEGWWRFADFDLRPDYPLMSSSTWMAVLEDLGFTAALSVPDGEVASGSDRSLILARNAPNDAAADADTDPWLVFADDRGIGDRVVSLIRANGHRCVCVRSGNSFQQIDVDEVRIPASDPQAYRSVVELSSGWAGVVHCWPMNDHEDDALVNLQDAQFGAMGTSHYLTLALASTSLRRIPRLWIATCEAQGPDSGSSAMAAVQAGVWGFGRVVALEHPELRCTLIDLEDSPQAAERLYTEIVHSSAEDEIVWRGTQRFVSRLTPFAPLSVEDADVEDKVRSLVLSSSGILEDIQVLPTDRVEPGPDQVEIRVRATGLNFRDVMNALAMRDDPEPVGSEVAGIVTAVGSAVEDIQVGDAVVAIASGGFSTHVLADAVLVVPKPARLTWEEAVTVPLAYLTAWFSLFKTGDLKAGERVLIHAGAGGVGLAAIQLAKSVGAEILATAGNAEKRQFLRELGASHVFDSRSLDFAQGVLLATRGQGVDLVLNSLSGEFIPRSLEVVRKGGRFVEIGKREIWSPAKVQEFRSDISYSLLNLLETLHEAPQTIRPLFLELIERIDREELSPLPLTRFVLDEVPAAFRFMAHARHIGKVVVAQPVSEPVLRPNASYLITGGLRGLGLLVARWLAESGAKYLVLLGRSSPDEATTRELAQLTDAGVNVRIVQADVSDRDQLESVLDSVRKELPPLRGIVHSAGVLEDGAIVTKDWERFSNVLGPKVAGAWHLHQLTTDLDFFVLFSSIASVLGGAGEADHAAANAFMDALARYRQGKGMPATSLNWGPWSEVGAATRYEVSDEGIHMIHPREGLDYLRQVMTDGAPQTMVCRVDWDAFARKNPAHARRPLLSSVCRIEQQLDQRTAPAPAAAVPTAEFLSELPANRRKKALVDYVIEQARSVLGFGGAQSLHPKKPLNEMGFDSLMSVELRNRLNAGLHLNTSLPATLVFDHPTADAIAEHLVGVMLTGPAEEMQEPAAAVSADDDLESIISSIESLSDDETSAWLSERTEREA